MRPVSVSHSWVIFACSSVALMADISINATCSIVAFMGNLCINATISSVTFMGNLCLKCDHDITGNKSVIFKPKVKRMLYCVQTCSLYCMLFLCCRLSAALLRHQYVIFVLQVIGWLLRHQRTRGCVSNLCLGVSPCSSLFSVLYVIFVLQVIGWLLRLQRTRGCI